MNNVVEQMLSQHRSETLGEKKNSIKEVVQEIILCGLSRAGFFQTAAFYGGTALRIFHGLDRFSEDLDFSLMASDSDFRLDIAVIDPFDQEEYMMGILLDGESYRRTANTRDREVSQAGVLRNLGWSLYRIWTVDWWDNRERELRKLLKELERQKEISRNRAEERKAKQEREKAAAEERQAEALRRNEELKSELEAAEAEVIAEAESEMYNVSSISAP